MEEADSDSRISGRKFSGPHYPNSETSVLSICDYVCMRMCMCIYIKDGFMLSSLGQLVQNYYVPSSSCTFH